MKLQSNSNKFKQIRRRHPAVMAGIEYYLRSQVIHQQRTGAYHEVISRTHVNRNLTD